ncbi:hypothetical protein Lgra_1026 [Legionella gratiana]|uniref:Uncharacterized protein n=1 Tax=Legionella gratiana TaxID=45066 RepID=A0A378J2Z7_9GAMM|nr:T4SS effector ferrous iron transporter IroT/MavN [Legionella gratiana]KTD11568.1 hypothetical protein Lgra_1026 [Legionella gratiana]STX41341.1 Uncharacterised protein [Legionella gratiana]
MAINKKKFPIKKIPYYLLLTLLTTGASLILGFLSFGGMYALIPALSVACATFGLSVAYEGEIYLQNIKGAFKKLFKSNYLENHLAKEYLLQNFPENTDDPDCPQFFKDYEKQLQLLSLFKHKQLDKESRKQKRQIEKTLADMEKWFALQLFPAKNAQSEELSAYALELRKWLASHQQKEWQEKLEKRQSTFNYVKGFSALAAAFMGLGSTYLLVEAFSVIPVVAAIPFAFWPIFIVPMSVIAGAAYGMLTYNTITDLINNDTIKKWYNKLRDDLSQGLTARNVFMTTMALFLAGLAVALTICTAGTWWTIATSARPLFEWMKKMPSFIMGVINPIITGLSAIFFNIQNTAESLEMVDEATRSNKNIFRSIYESVTENLAHVRDTENWLQIFNPFRLLLKLTITPLRILLFLGHLVSIAVTSDRMPGVPQIVSALVGIISEGFEDAHYFAGHEEKSSQDVKKTATLLKERLAGDAENESDTDIPTRLLKVIASPLYALAAIWDYLASKLNATSDAQGSRKTLTLTQAWNKQLGVQEETKVVLPTHTKHPSQEWKVEHTAYLIDKYSRKHLNQVKIGTALADDKSDALKELKGKVRAKASNSETLNEILTTAKNNPVYNQHRLFALSKDEKTTTQEFVEDLSERVNALV